MRHLQYLVPLSAISVLLAAAVLALLAGCGTTPEAKLDRGYSIVSGAARTTTVLVQRGAVSADDAQLVHDAGTAAKAILDAGKDRLTACRAAGNTDCGGAVRNIDLGAGILLQLEHYLTQARIAAQKEAAK